MLVNDHKINEFRMDIEKNQEIKCVHMINKKSMYDTLKIDLFVTLCVDVCWILIQTKRNRIGSLQTNKLYNFWRTVYHLYNVT